MWDPSRSQVVALKEKIVKYCLRWREQPVILEFLWIFQSIALQTGLYARIRSRVQKQAQGCIQDCDLGQFLRSRSILISPTKRLLTPAILAEFFLPWELIWLEVSSLLSLERVLKPRACESHLSPVRKTANRPEVVQLCAGGENSLPPIYNRNGPSQIRKKTNWEHNLYSFSYKPCEIVYI